MKRFRSYRKRKSYVPAIIIILLAAVLTATSPLYIRPLFSAVMYPFQLAGATLWKGLVGVPSFFINLRHASAQNRQLKKELQSIKPRLQVFEELRQENTRLRAALDFRENNPYQLNLLAARVVARSFSPWFSMVEINKGSRAGVRENMAVVAEKGVVGRVIEVSVFSSKVLLLTDAESSVAALDARSRDSGIIAGGLPDKLSMKYVSAGGDVGVGDQVVTSHISAIFPPGLPIGTVSAATKREQDLFYHIEIKPAVDFLKIENVFVVI